MDRLDKKHPSVKFDPFALCEKSELHLKSCFKAENNLIFRNKFQNKKNSATFQDEMIAKQRLRNQSSLLAQRRQLANMAMMQKPIVTEPSASFQYSRPEGSLTPLEACFDVELMKQQL